MEPFNQVAFQIVNGSGGGPDIKGCHGNLKDMRNVRRTIVRVDNRRHTSLRDIFADQVLDYRFGLLIFDRPSGKPPCIDIDHGKERRISLFGGLERTYEIKTYFFSWTTDKVVSIRMTLHILFGKTLATRAFKYIFATNANKSRENVFKLNSIGQGVSSGMIPTMKGGKYSFLKNLWQGYPAILLVSERNGLPDKDSIKIELKVLKAVYIKLFIGRQQLVLLYTVNSGL